MKLPRSFWNFWRWLEHVAPDSIALRLMYRRKIGRVLHLRNPRAFGEKIQWMKLYYRPRSLAPLADKFTVREFVAQQTGAVCLNEIYGCWDSPDDIPFDALPDRCALKVSSASHANLFCTNRGALDPDLARRKLAEWMQMDQYHGSREWAYKHCTPRIICEKFLDDGTGGSPTDYKLFCFDGKPAFIEVAIGRSQNLTLTLYDLNWIRLPFGYSKYPAHPAEIPPPATLGEMVDYAQKLSAGFPFMRVDLYCVHGRTVFGEITWYPSSGLMPFHPYRYELEVGAMLRLPSPVHGDRPTSSSGPVPSLT